MTRNRWRGRVAAGLAAATLLVTAVGAPAGLGADPGRGGDEQQLGRLRGDREHLRESLGQLGRAAGQELERGRFGHVGRARRGE